MPRRNSALQQLTTTTGTVKPAMRSRRALRAWRDAFSIVCGAVVREAGRGWGMCSCRGVAKPYADSLFVRHLPAPRWLRWLRAVTAHIQMPCTCAQRARGRKLTDSEQGTKHGRASHRNGLRASISTHSTSSLLSNSSIMSRDADDMASVRNGRSRDWSELSEVKQPLHHERARKLQKA